MILHIDCNSFYASCEQAFRPDLIGKPVVVANCNEAGGGIILALSKEAKALGLKRGNPVFQVKEILDRHKVAVFPANLPKYVDISRRLMQVVREQDIVLNLQQYSVDEFFCTLPLDDPGQLREYTFKVKNKIEQCTCIPVSCGVSLSYTLAKVATWYAKHYKGYEGVCVLSKPNIEVALRGLPVEDVWGVGRRSAPRMLSMGIKTAWDFVQKPEYFIQKAFKITGLRTWKELRGTPCIHISNPALQKTMTHTRTFAFMTSDWEKMRSYVSSYAVAVARKLRDQHSVCLTVGVFIATNPHREDLSQYRQYGSVRLNVATSDTSVIVKAALKVLADIFQPNFMYKRAGVYLMEITPDDAIQLDFFDSPKQDLDKSRKLMKALDEITIKYGMDSVRMASQCFDEPSVKLENFQQPKNESTNINDVIKVN